MFTLKFLGWVLAHMPEFILRGVSTLLGNAVFAVFRSRRRLILSNLHHAFPDRSPAWRGRIARESCRRMIETGLLSLATPYLSEPRIRSIAQLAPSVQTLARELADRPRPVVLGTVHFALWEAQTWLKLLSPITLPEFGIIFRPLDSPTADAWVKTTRERFGMKLLSRKQGFAEAQQILRGNGCIGVLFDQNAGMQGALTLLFDRVCSTTELPGLLAAKFGADVRAFYPRRTGFWRVSFETAPVANNGTTEGVTMALNQWLEATLAADEDLCASWLWAHDRWRNQDRPSHRLRLEAKRNLLTGEITARPLRDMPQRTRIWIRLPNWLGDVVMALPLLDAIRGSRPDAELTIVARKQYLPLLSSWRVADRYHALPEQGFSYWTHFLGLRGEYIDTWILLTNSFRGDLEALLAGVRQRFGVIRPGKPRPLLTHGYRVPPDFKERDHHQLELWENFIRHFGLHGPIARNPLVHVPGTDSASFAERCGRGDLTARPVAPESQSTSRCHTGPIGLICGSENTPEKRWPVEHWRALIEAFPDERFVVFGTSSDVATAAAVSAGFESSRVENLAGKTDLASFADRLRGCRLLVTNDTGGMHLANALGVPLIVLFGPTNPVRTGPVFDPPTQILQPPNCPPTGGGSLAELPPETVVTCARTLLARPPISDHSVPTRS